MQLSIGDRVETAHGPGRVTRDYGAAIKRGRRIQIVTAELDRPYRDKETKGALEMVRTLEVEVPIDGGRELG